MMKTTFAPRRPRRSSEAGFSLIEMLVAMGIMLVVMGGAMAAMMDATRASKMASMITSMNSNLRTAMDLMVRDTLQTGQDLPVGRVIEIPSGTGAARVRMPGPPGTAFLTPVGATTVSAVTAYPGAGPLVNSVATDVYTILAADSSFSNVDLTALSNSSATIALPGAGINGYNITDGGPDDVLAGQLLMLTKGSLSTLVQVSRRSGQQIFFDANDSLTLNQTAAANGTLTALNASAPANSGGTAAQAVQQTQATRIRMITYYIDATINPQRPRLVRRMNNGSASTFDNNSGTTVAFDVENLQVSYDIANGVTNPANVKMNATDLLTTGSCAPQACSPNQIRKVNIMLAGRSYAQFSPLKQPLRNVLQSQVSLRSLAFVDKYTDDNGGTP
jgi:prepilin-type N-terminal cleavage/methylation domain-containing protein